MSEARRAVSSWIASAPCAPPPRAAPPPTCTWGAEERCGAQAGGAGRGRRPGGGDDGGGEARCDRARRRLGGRGPPDAQRAHRRGSLELERALQHAVLALQLLVVALQLLVLELQRHVRRLQLAELVERVPAPRDDPSGRRCTARREWAAGRRVGPHLGPPRGARGAQAGADEIEARDRAGVRRKPMHGGRGAEGERAPCKSRACGVGQVVTRRLMMHIIACDDR